MHSDTHPLSLGPNCILIPTEQIQVLLTNLRLQVQYLKITQTHNAGLGMAQVQVQVLGSVPKIYPHSSLSLSLSGKHHLSFHTFLHLNNFLLRCTVRDKQNH